MIVMCRIYCVIVPWNSVSTNALCIFVHNLFYAGTTTRWTRVFGVGNLFLDDFFSFLSLFIFDFFLGRSHSHRGMNNSISSLLYIFSLFTFYQHPIIQYFIWKYDVLHVWLSLTDWGHQEILNYSLVKESYDIKYNEDMSHQWIDLERKSAMKLILVVVVQNFNILLLYLDCATHTASLQISISNRGFRTGWKYCISNTRVAKTTTGLTKEVVKNYLPKFCALMERRIIFCCEPVGALHWFQVVIQSLIKECMLFFGIGVEGFNEAFSGTGAGLSEPKGMFKADENSWTYGDKKKKSQKEEHQKSNLWKHSKMAPIGIGINEWGEVKKIT